MSKFLFQYNCPAWQSGQAIKFFGVGLIPDRFVRGIEVALLEKSGDVGGCEVSGRKNFGHYGTKGTVLVGAHKWFELDMAYCASWNE